MAASAAGAALPPTMRVDYYHTGNAVEEHFSLDRVLVEPLPWPGNPARAIDADRGKYFFEVVDTATGQVVFSRGFSSIYGEWETTGEAKVAMRTFSESLRFPLIDRPARVVVKKRDARNAFRDIWTLPIDPSDKFIDRSGTTAAAGPVIKIHESGDPADKLDLLILGDGYTAAERSKFERDARRLTAVLFATSPFKERQRDINVWGLVPASTVSGVTRPSQHVHKHTPLGTTYDAFDTERYVLTFENRAFRDIAANAPYDAVEILVNSATYGGGGIYGLYARLPPTACGLPHLRARIRTSHCRSGRRAYTRTSPISLRPIASSRGSPTRRRFSIRGAQMERSRRRRHTPPTPWPKEEFERYTKRSSNGGAASVRRTVPKRDGCADARGTGPRHGRPNTGPWQESRRVRRSQLRSARILPPSGGLHHVQSRHRSFCACAGGRSNRLDLYSRR